MEGIQGLSKKQEKKKVDDGIFRGLYEMIAWFFCFDI